MSEQVEQVIPGEPSQLVLTNVESYFTGVHGIELYLVTNDMAYSYEDTWHLDIEFEWTDLKDLGGFLKVLGGQDKAYVDAYVRPSSGGWVHACFSAHRSMIGDLWGAPTEVDRKPWPGMEFERPDSDSV